MRMLVTFFKAVVQPALLFGSEMCLLNTRMGQMLGGFPHRVARPLMEKETRRLPDSGWDYPLLEEVMQEAGLKEVE